MKAQDILDNLSDEAREAILQSVAEAYCAPCYQGAQACQAMLGRAVAHAIEEELGQACSDDREAAALAREQDRGWSIEKSVQVKAMRRAA